MSLILQALQASMNNHTLVGIHSDRGDSSKFSVGWITALSDEFYCLEEVDEFAGPDGVSIQRLNDIWFIEREGPYIQRIQSLVESNLAFANRYTNFRIANMNEALRDLHRRKQIVSVVLDDRSTATGPISEVSEGEVAIRNYNKVGIYDGEEIYRISDLYRIEFAGKRESTLESTLRRQESAP